ncbi:fumarate reductase subunit FrdD [Rheinheimera oceanensis]|uniref:fumarate reductase subunit FrdD n=1 Tax=Rheinheimera oceanensis TaxID=2817449 RepID=UPI001BFE5E3F|nr:fumarate reductase subunit FrdD [Rheinheimera oceanensis]
MNSPKRSDEPIWWALFSAGGVCFAVFLPGLILALGILWPLGLLNSSVLQYAQLLSLLQSGYGLTGLAFTGAVICLPLFHAAHRIHHGLHDLKCGYRKSSKLLCYGTAAALSMLALYLTFHLILAD